MRDTVRTNHPARVSLLIRSEKRNGYGVVGERDIWFGNDDTGQPAQVPAPCHFIARMHNRSVLDEQIVVCTDSKSHDGL